MTKIIQAEAVPASVLHLDGPDHNDWYVVAETKRGNAYILNHIFDNETQAERLAHKVRAKGVINLDHWTFWRTVYGTDAYLAEEAEAALWADQISRGYATEADAPSNIRTLL